MNAITPINRLYTAHELAPLLSLPSHRSVYDLVRYGHIKAVRIGRALRISYDEVCRLTGNEPFDW